MNIKYYYYTNQPEYYIRELEICFEKLELYSKVYETLYAFVDFIETIKLFNSRLSNHPQKITFKSFLTKVKFFMNRIILLNIKYRILMILMNKWDMKWIL